MKKYEIKYTDKSAIRPKIIKTDFDMSRFDLEKLPLDRCYGLNCDEIECPLYGTSQRRCHIGSIESITEIKEEKQEFKVGDMVNIIIPLEVEACNNNRVMLSLDMRRSLPLWMRPEHLKLISRPEPKTAYTFTITDKEKKLIDKLLEDRRIK